jgi:hypothetical protein
MLKHLSWQVYLEWMGILAVAWYCWFVVRFVVPRWQQTREDKKKQRAPVDRADYFPEKPIDSTMEDE